VDMEHPVPDFAEVLRALTDESRPFPSQYLYHLGDLSPEDAAHLREVWPKVPLQRRRGIVEDLEVITDADLTASFKEVGLLALDDPDAAVRFGGIRLLWMEDDYNLIPRLLALATHDPDTEVRANAVGALGTFMYLAALEELPWKYTHDIETTLMGFLKNEAEADLVRRQALEALGYSLNLDMVPWIEEAFASPSEEWQASALFAAGRSGQEQWSEQVLSYLHNTNPRLRAEAARAAGELMLEDARDDLLELLEDVNADVRMMAAWALSEIGGGEEVAAALEAALENAADEEEELALEEAMSNLAFTDEMEELLMMDLSPEDLEDMIHDEDIDDLLDLFGDDDEEA
jgi:hypothetical protein